MLSQKIEIFQVIEDWIISKKTTLKEDIINAIRKNSPLTDNEIINIVVKYFVSYLYPDKINQQISEIDINYLYSLTNFFFKISRNSWIVIENLTKEEINLLDFIQKNIFLWLKNIYWYKDMECSHSSVGRALGREPRSAVGSNPAGSTIYRIY